MEKKKAEDEWFVAAFDPVFANTHTRTPYAAPRHRRDASDESRRRPDTGSTASTPSPRPHTHHRRDLVHAGCATRSSAWTWTTAARSTPTSSRVYS